MAYECLQYEVKENIGTVTLNRPEKLNALNGTLRDELNAVCQEIYTDDEVRVAIFTGAGRGFCSGADVTGPRPEGVPETAGQNQRLDEMGWVGKLAISIYEIGVPTIAAMNGVAAGAGMSIALACDMR
ncbi:MAG: enoyl-CoA hydratase/isomerase family protein, partial [Pseudomonadales bacterium]|nr:enoyl-CoA hydratase/isomerase family protein [Pseudomonadales bacterium]